MSNFNNSEAVARTELSVYQLLEVLITKLSSCYDQSRPYEPYTANELEYLYSRSLVAQTRINSLRNACLAPINRLPKELIAHIFTFLPPTVSSFLPTLNKRLSGVQYKWFNVITVCRYWREAALSFPTVWSTVDSSKPKGGSVVLDRSCAAAIDILLYDAVFRSQSVVKENPLVQAISNNSKRIREMHVDVDYKLGHSVLELFCNPAPILTSLTIATKIDPTTSDATSSEIVLPTIFSGETPNIKHLTITYFSSWPGNNFTNLVELCLNNQATYGRVHLDAFLDFLDASSKTLERLILINASPTPDHRVNLAEIQGRVAEFTKLNSLELGEWPSDHTITRFLSSIDIPSHTVMHIWGPANHTALPARNSIFPPFWKSRLHNTKAITKLQITHSRPNSARLDVTSVQNGEVHISGISFTSESLFATLETFHLSFVRELVLGVTAGRKDIPRDEWKTRLFQHMPNLQTLVISERSSRPILSALCLHDDVHSPEESHSDTEHGSATVTPDSQPLLCPNLRTLEIIDDRAISTLYLCFITEEREKLGFPLTLLRVQNMTSLYSQRLEEDLMHLKRYSKVRVECLQERPGGRDLLEDCGGWPTIGFEWTKRSAGSM